MRRWLTALLALAWSPAVADAPTIRMAALSYGTVNWELETIRRLGLDEERGFALEVLPVASGNAAKIAVRGGAADAFVGDWIWVARQRAEGQDYVLVPYSVAVGGIAVPKDRGIEALADLKGMRIGIAGGPLDKGWLILRALAEREGFDLAAETEQVFGAPPLLARKAVAGELDAVINYWHWLARIERDGWRVAVPVGEAAEKLGLDPTIPLLGYVFDGAFARENPELMRAFKNAVEEAKATLVSDDAAWEPLRPLAKGEDDALFVALREGWREGAPPDMSVDVGAVRDFLAVMARLGGEALVGRATELPDGVFHFDR